MRVLTLVRAVSATAVLVTISACSNVSVIAPRASLSGGHENTFTNIASELDSHVLFKLQDQTPDHFPSFNSCPASGPIEYISDFNNSIVSIYAGNFAGQNPCGMLTSANGLENPQGLFVKNHNLYVANAGDVLEFARGGTSAIRTYVDMTGGPQNEIFPADVTVAKDGTVIATNIAERSDGIGSISTWASNGTFIGNFPNANGLADFYVTVQKDGTVYWDDSSLNLWKGNCPAGACGTFRATGAFFTYPGGVRSADHEDVVLLDAKAPGGAVLTTYEPTDFRSGVFCTIAPGDDVLGFDINRSQHHAFYADFTANVGGEVEYPSCKKIGTVPGNPDGELVGVAVDAPESL